MSRRGYNYYRRTGNYPRYRRVTTPALVGYATVRPAKPDEAPYVAVPLPSRWRINERQRVRKANAWGAAQNTILRPCPTCGLLFRMPKTAYCSARCASVAQAARRRDLVLVGEPFTAAEIAERDNWICQLCHRPIDPAATTYAESLTIDHIMPVSKNGEHSFVNVQAAHWSCNSAKGNR